MNAQARGTAGLPARSFLSDAMRQAPSALRWPSLIALRYFPPFSIWLMQVTAYVMVHCLKHFELALQFMDKVQIDKKVCL